MITIQQRNSNISLLDNKPDSYSAPIAYYKNTNFVGNKSCFIAVTSNSGDSSNQLVCEGNKLLINYFKKPLFNHSLHYQ